jgi:hypothetical protein
MHHSIHLRMIDRLQNGHRTHYDEARMLKPHHCKVFHSYMLQELLFCETCDTVFCTLCTGGSHSTSGTSCEHTIIPFSIAIKRMSEILLYKANECISKVAMSCISLWFSLVTSSHKFVITSAFYISLDVM